MTPLRFAWREIRHRPAYAGLFALSAAMGAAVLMALSGFGAAVERAVKAQAREIWGGDATVNASPPLLDALEGWAAGRWPGAATARRTDVFSMARFPKADRALQISIDAVSPSYPLYGSLSLESGEPARPLLAPGAMLADRKLLAQLGAEVGDTLRVGTLDMRIAGVLGERSDVSFSFFEFAPAVVMTREDLAASGLLAPGSRTRDTLYINFPPGTAVPAALEELKARAAGETAEVSSWTKDQPGILKFLKNTLLFLDFLGLLTLTLGGVGVASTLSASLAASAHSMGMALALGAPRRYLMKVWLCWVFLLTSAGMALALLLARGLAGLLVGLFGDMLPFAFEVGFPAAALARSAALCGAVSLVFTFAPLLKLMDLPPNMVLSGGAPARPARPGRAAALFLAGAAVFYGVVLAQVGKPLLALYYWGGLAGVLLSAWGFSAGLMALVRRCLFRRRGVVPRLAGRGLSRPGQLNDAVVVSMAVSLVAILTLFLLERNLTAQWVESFPEDAPTLFCINVQKEQKEKFLELLGVPGVRLFPLVRGRVVEVNGVSVREFEARAEARRGQGDRLTREFGFTFGEDLLPTDKVVAGKGLWDGAIAGPQVSVYDEYHERFGINLGDEITVNVLGRKHRATVSSLRSIDETARQPFFYFYFKPGLLDGAPHTYMAGVHVPAGDIPALENKLAKELPNVTAVDVSKLAALTGKVLKRFRRVVNALGFFGVGAGLALLVSGLWVTLASRTWESVMFRTLGAGRRQVAAVYFLEYALIAGAAVLSAWGVGTAAAWAVMRFGFKSPFAPYGALAGALMAAAAGLMVALALLASARAFRAAPMEVLRYE